MDLDAAVIWPESPLITGTMDDLDPASMWDRLPQIPETQPEPWHVPSHGEHFAPPLVLDTVRCASPGHLDQWVVAVSYSEVAKTNGIPGGSLLLYPVTVSGDRITCMVAGEPFQLDFRQDDSDRYILQHHRWSLCGFGHTFAEAVQDLWDMAHAVASDYLDLDPSALTESALDLRQFLQRVR